MDPIGRAYEDFVPPHHMVREPPTHTLSVDLSAAGYKKEHIRVQLVHSHRRLTVRGERPVAGNRWSRFRLEFKLPDGCDTRGIHARFEKGFVRVTMPGLKTEPVAVDAAGQQEPASPAAKPNGATPGVQGGDRAAPAPPTGRGEAVLEKDQDKTKVKKQEADQHPKDGGRDGDDVSAGGAAPSRQGYAFLHDRKKTATTVLGVVLVLISLGIYVRYSFAA